MFGNFGAISGAKSEVALEQACPLLSGSTYRLAPVIRPALVLEGNKLVLG